ncbi:MAG TPA: hypothetical protein PLP69_00640 [Bacteroidales bacterium]|nr:hypothetical protein [Bacteroidales bacterium]
MKRMVFLLVILLCGNAVHAQKMIDIYKKGPVKLVADKSYGAGNNWEALFNHYYDTLTSMDKVQNRNKKIIVAPDGSVFMSHKNRHEIWKFGPDGNLIKKFGAKGGKQDQFPMIPNIQTIVDGKYILTCDANSRLRLFDFEGKHYKSQTLDYMTRGFQSLGNGELLAIGMVMWKETEPGTNITSYRWRNIVVRLNIFSGEEKILYSMFGPVDMQLKNAESKDKVEMLSVSSPDGKIHLPSGLAFDRPCFSLLSDGRFLVSNAGTGEVKVFSKEGREVSSFKLDIKPLAITEEDVLQNYKMVERNSLKLIDDANKSERSEEQKQKIIEQARNELKNKDRYKDISNYYPHLPYFSNILLDDEGNLLVFEYTKNESNLFNVIAYDNAGTKLATTSFQCDDYDIYFSGNTFVISKGYVYAVAKLKNAKGMPLRLVKFKMTN